MNKLKKKSLGLIGLVPAIIVPFVTANCSVSISESEIKEKESKKEEDEKDLSENSGSSIITDDKEIETLDKDEKNDINKDKTNDINDDLWINGSNNKLLTDEEKKSQIERFSKIKIYYDLFLEYKKSNDQIKMNSLFNSLEVNTDEEESILEALFYVDSQEELHEYKQVIENLYDKNKIKYCFIGYLEYENKIEQWWNESKNKDPFNLSDALNKEKSYYEFLVFNSFFLPSFGNIILSSLLKESLNQNNIPNVHNNNFKNEYFNLIEKYLGNAKVELELYKSWLNN